MKIAIEGIWYDKENLAEEYAKRKNIPFIPANYSYEEGKAISKNFNYLFNKLIKHIEEINNHSVYVSNITPIHYLVENIYYHGNISKTKFLNFGISALQATRRYDIIFITPHDPNCKIITNTYGRDNLLQAAILGYLFNIPDVTKKIRILRSFTLEERLEEMDFLIQKMSNNILLF